MKIFFGLIFLLAFGFAQRTVLGQTGLEKKAEELFVKGVKEYNQGKYPEAIELWKKAANLYRYKNIYYNLALAYRKLKDNEKEKEYLILALKTGWTKTLDIYAKIVDLSRKTDDGANLKAYAKEGIEFFKEAVKVRTQLLHLLKQVIGYSILTKDCQFGAFLKPFARRFEVELVALSKFQEGCGIDTPEQFFARGRAKLASKNFHGAIQDLLMANRSYPNHLPYVLELARAYYYANQKDLAIQYLKRALTIDPRNFAAKELLDKLTKTAAIVFRLHPDIQVTCQGERIAFQPNSPIPFVPGRHLFHLFDPQQKRSQEEVVILKAGETLRIGWRKVMDPFRITAWTLLSSGALLGIIGGILYATAKTQDRVDPVTHFVTPEKNIGPSTICWGIAGGLIVTSIIFFFIKPRAPKKVSAYRKTGLSMQRDPYGTFNYQLSF